MAINANAAMAIISLQIIVFNVQFPIANNVQARVASNAIMDLYYSQINVNLIVLLIFTKTEIYVIPAIPYVSHAIYYPINVSHAYQAQL